MTNISKGSEKNDLSSTIIFCFPSSGQVSLSVSKLVHQVDKVSVVLVAGKRCWVTPYTGDHVSQGCTSLINTARILGIYQRYSYLLRVLDISGTLPSPTYKISLTRYDNKI